MGGWGGREQHGHGKGNLDTLPGDKGLPVQRARMLGKDVTAPVGDAQGNLLIGHAQARIGQGGGDATVLPHAKSSLYLRELHAQGLRVGLAVADAEHKGDIGLQRMPLSVRARDA